MSVSPSHFGLHGFAFPVVLPTGGGPAPTPGNGTLLASPAAIVRQLLLDLGLAVAGPTADWSVFAANEPAGPDNCVTVRGTQGVGEAETHFGVTTWHRGIQVRVRSSDHEAGYAKAAGIGAALETLDVHAVSVGGACYLAGPFSPAGEVMDLGKDVPNGKRWIFTCNYLGDFAAADS